jgi:hypothetical protein
MNTLLNSWASTRTYASEAALLKAVTKLGFDTRGMLVVQVPGTNRYSAVFAKSFFIENTWMRAVHCGFKVLG